ncbi:Lsr2 family protein [Plantibacter flavus]|uniref:Lsr2 dimerization domain-containing protein n=1 Tax=Plantibacter flavus TaxID=150123 RepID=UPI003F161233
MAMRRTVTTVDDITGEPLDDRGESLVFVFDGSAYEIDLSADNAAAFREAVAPYVSAARPLHGIASTRRPGGRRNA